MEDRKSFFGDEFWEQACGSKKSEWGEGPWQSEPDKEQWIDRATGFACLIVRSHGSGALCGYVGVPPDHALYQRNYDACPDLKCHGGLTFSGHCQAGEGTMAICHKTETDEADLVWWLGFDTAHGFDLMLAMKALLRKANAPAQLLEPRDWERYRDIAYVKANVAALAKQLAAMK